ncbi:MAG: N-formylglutamate amidohydrolase [Deltaproteobacteria bacterium]|nr:N-formylglutamate amidohydrolase [Deltaproteobacteria bacterium]
MKATKGWSINRGDSPFVAFAIHAGHTLRTEIKSVIAIDDDVQLREEDPFTEQWTQIAPTQIVVDRSRFEVDLNRSRDESVYLTPDDAWGLNVWRETPDLEMVEHSKEAWDLFYEEIKTTLSAIERTHGRFIVFDFHSYNHRRDGAEAAPADAGKNPVVNVGTGALNRKLWKPVIDAFIDTVSEMKLDGTPLDVRENVKFKGGFLSRWIAETFPESACVLAIDVKKVFMDEWTGTLHPDKMAVFTTAFEKARNAMAVALKKVQKKKKNMAFSPGVGKPMRIGFVVNDVTTEQPTYTTVRLAMAAKRMGHEIYMFGTSELAYDNDEKIKAHASTVPRRIYKNGLSFLKDLTDKHRPKERISVDDLDVLMLRSDPAQDAITRPWAAQAGIEFGRVAMRNGVIVLNDPDGLAKANSKMYFQTFPAEIRPETIITRNRDDIRSFAREKGTVVLKPLTGSGGANVFMVRPEDLPNINQIIDSVLRDGFAIVQEYLEAAEEGDVRLFVMNGEAFRYKGHYCAFRRLRKGGDLRSNLHAGGTLGRAEIGNQALEMVEMVRPKLIQDGMFLVGLDIVGNKLMEINVFSPGGLGSAQKFEGVNFSEGVIKALQRKTMAMSYYKRQFDNVSMSIV